MGLTSKQKEYIHKNIKHFPIETLADNLDVEQEIIKKYLKKIWRWEKYNKYIHNNTPGDISENPQADFIPEEFFQKNLFIFVGLFFLVFAMYVNSLWNGFVSDDIPAVLNNPYIKDVSTIFHNGLFGSFQEFLYFLSYKIGGLHPASFRIFNVLFHTGSTFLVFLILSALAKKRIALFAAMLFAVHPLLTETVVWISSSPYAIGTFFSLLVFLGYITNTKKYWPLFFFFLALLTSEKVVIFPLLLSLYEFSFGGMNRIKRNWKKLIPYFGLSVVYTVILLSKLGGRISAIEAPGFQQGSEGMFNPLVQVPIAVGNYLKLIFWPDTLTLYHTEMSFNTGQYLFYLLIFFIFLAVIFWGWKRNKAVFFWMSFFFISLLPTLTPLKVSWIVAERYVYLGSIGIFVGVAIFFNWVWEKAQEKNITSGHIMTALFAIIIVSLSVRTIIRSMDWKNEDTLWIATAKTSPSGQVIHNNLGDVYDRQGNPEKAVEEFKKAIDINPRYADAYHNLGNTYRDMGKIDLATENYRKALEFNPRLWQSYQNLAVISFNQGDFQKASEYIEEALKIDPQNKNLQENLQVIREKMP